MTVLMTRKCDVCGGDMPVITPEYTSSYYNAITQVTSTTITDICGHCKQKWSERIG